MEKVNTMRVIGGKYRHRKLFWPNDKNVRPTKDRIREAIFNSLGPIEGFSFLDLFSGSGAIGIEALSRGASKVFFTDNNRPSIECTLKNLNSLNINNNEYKIISDDYKNALEQFKNSGDCFDVIFLDPPYLEGRYEEIVSYCLNNNLIKENGVFILESNRDVNIDESLFRKIKVYKYGEIMVTFLWR